MAEACRADYRCYRNDGHEGLCRDPETNQPIPPADRVPLAASQPPSGDAPNPYFDHADAPPWLRDDPAPSGDALREALVAAITDAADIRLPDGRLVIAVRHAVALIENTALATPAPLVPSGDALREALRDEAGRSPEWYDGYNAAMRDYDKRVATPAPLDVEPRNRTTAVLFPTDAGYPEENR